MENIRKILLASPRGFCAGVFRAVETVDKALGIFSNPLHVHHEIVHNREVVRSFEKKGVVFINELHEMPDNLPVIFSAHGVSPEVRKVAVDKHLQVIDATCPLVTKVHLEAIRYAREGYHIFYIGHKNHPETIGTVGEVPGCITIIETLQSLDNIDISHYGKTAYLTQTTLSQNETNKIINKLVSLFPNISKPEKTDICYATTNRQEAIKEISKEAQIFLIVGSQNSSNSNRLKELAESLGKPAYLVDDASMIQKEWISDNIHCIGITSGASAPEKLVVEIVQYLQNNFNFNNVQERIYQEENTVFQLPSELQKLLTE